MRIPCKSVEFHGRFPIQAWALVSDVGSWDDIGGNRDPSAAVLGRFAAIATVPKLASP